MAKGTPRGSDAAALLGAAAFERYSLALGRYLKRRVHRPEDVADLTQEIFELFVRRKEQPAQVRDPLAYLFRIAFHVVGEALADEGRNPVTFDSRLAGGDFDAGEPTSSADDAEALAIEKDVKAALESLPQGYLTALLLVEGHGMSYKEAAQASGFTPATIATYLMHGRAALKLALDDAWKERETRK